MYLRIEMSFLLSTLLLFLACSCSSVPKAVDGIGFGVSKYDLADNSGKFLVIREVGYNKKRNDFIVKRQVKDVSGDGKILEKSIVISSLGRLGKRASVLRPKISQYTVWFDAKKYFTELKINKETKSMDIRMVSPEKQWNGSKSIRFPKGTGVFCFYDQLVECVKATGFLTKAISRKTGNMNFHIVVNGYPYFQEQYLNIPTKLFHPAKLSYDGVTKKGGFRFSVEFGGQTMFYVFNKDEAFIKKLWVQQGLSMIKHKD